MRTRPFASLATLEAGTNYPYASLIAAATSADGSPILLISRLAWHTRNLEADPRATILFAADESAADPLDSGRVGVMGTAERIDDPLIRARFLARHPKAALYADFGDFAFWRLSVERAHFVGGFGRIFTLSAAQLLIDPEAAAAWDAAIGSVIETVNRDCAEIVARLAALKSGEGGEWRLAACDPDGCDLVLGERSLRIVFKEPLSSPSQAIASLYALAEGAV
ncbi:MAG: heme iron utilization protein [Rhodomicrobium sp.]|nr:heme iron utilization protein [Rhodomicrobium sp.]